MKDKRFRQDFVNGLLFYGFLVAVVIVVGSLLDFLFGVIFGAVASIAAVVLIVLAIIGAALLEAKIKKRTRE